MAIEAVRNTGYAVRPEQVVAGGVKGRQEATPERAPQRETAARERTNRADLPNNGPVRARERGEAATRSEPTRPQAPIVNALGQKTGTIINTTA